LKVRRAEINDLDQLVEFTAAEAREAEGHAKEAETLKIGIKTALEDDSIAMYWVLMNQVAHRRESSSQGQRYRSGQSASAVGCRCRGAARPRGCRRPPAKLPEAEESGPSSGRTALDPAVMRFARCHGRQPPIRSGWPSVAHLSPAELPCVPIEEWL
jgi:hypothetical protein